MNDKYITISQLTRYIKYKIDNDVNLNEVFIKGEISNFKAHSRGHYYFTIKDEASRINAVMFQTATKKLAFTPEDGMKVLVTGKISVFEANGGYQIYVNDMLEDGVGNLYIAFEQLKKKLEMEGLFDPSIKKKIPKIPNRVGVVTAPTGAAELAVPAISDVSNYLNQLKIRLNKSMQNKITIQKQKLNKITSRYIFTNPISIYQTKEMLFDSLIDRLKYSTVNLVTKKEKKYLELKNSYIFKTPYQLIDKKANKYLQIVSKLETLSPLETIKRGYTMTKINNKVVTSSKKIKKGDHLEINFSDGTVEAEVV